MSVEIVSDVEPGLPATALPEGWRWGTLGEALRHRKQFITIVDEKTYRLVTVQLHGRGVKLRGAVAGKSIKTKKQQVIRANDFLVAEIDAKMGGFGIVPEDLDGAIVSSHYFCFELDETKLLRGCLALFVRIGYVTEHILDDVRGSLNYAAIRPRHVQQVPFPYAPLEVQRELTSQMRTVDVAIAALNEQREAYEKLPAAIVRAAMQVESNG
jgi:type I restriction enzyme S subunit